ncbi:methyltransferase, FkbM subfamily protein [Acanthamoeba castellanii str. Neff]|uniref:Methyltransferase, FkbM subfamily protein n=1 Tax=Acanthamoeba castellanii (strain ATCC 30010 / Neff) TaxID=1257118 RepID=L8HBU2_ACACF|nr:methyltransferase, FkbM subfamily protein [Acanthamoeba castellanii str. Neff]ELR22655.1 methyltransferase, FkbM subfamily protein [Acanthamoeba castellanii str. Neff]
MNQSNSSRLLLGGMVVLIVLNYFIFYNVIDRQNPGDGGIDQNQLRKAITVDILEMQLERKENRIRELEQQVASAKSGGRPSTALAQAKPKQTLHVGWQWQGRETRKVRFFDGNEAYVYKTTYEGSMANPHQPHIDWWDVIESRSWEIETFFVYKTFLGPTSSFIDFGSWIGPTVLYGATLAKNGYALEPDPYAFDEVRANLALNPRLQDHTSIFWKCIMDKPGIYPMGGGGGDSMASVGSANHPKSWKVDCMTLPQFINEHQIENLHLIKMDPEGAEHIILPSFKPWLMQQKVKPTLWLSIHKWNFAPGGAEAVVDVLRLYKRVFEGHQNQVDINSYTLCDFCTILATDLDVPIYHE